MLNAFEERVEEMIHGYVMSELPLGLYDPNQPRRPRRPVTSFVVEQLEIDDDAVAHVAGPVVLQTPGGEVEQFLRVSVPVAGTNGSCQLETDRLRAAYIVLTNPESGACKETAALANA